MVIVKQLWRRVVAGFEGISVGGGLRCRLVAFAGCDSGFLNGRLY